MPEMPPMMPGVPKPEKSTAERLEELNQAIERLNTEIQELEEKLMSEKTSKEKSLSKGDELLDKDTAITGGSSRPKSRRKSVDEVKPGKLWEIELSRKMQERAGYILERDGLAMGQKKDGV